MNIITHLNEFSGDEASALRAVVSRLRAIPERAPTQILTDRLLNAIAGERETVPLYLRVLALCRRGRGGRSRAVGLALVAHGSG